MLRLNDTEKRVFILSEFLYRTFPRVPEIIFWHIPSKAYKKVAPKFNVRRHCVGSIFLENVAAQEAEMGIMKVLEQRPSVKVRSSVTKVSISFRVLHHCVGFQKLR